MLHRIPFQPGSQSQLKSSPLALHHIFNLSAAQHAHFRMDWNQMGFQVPVRGPATMPFLH
jgi:hypothetical protein